tara:strand:+ start:489 stop:1025 length:537 start_codon:yes stop_codon:yes gene_type:complete
MNIEEFLQSSEGTWISMRSTHTLSFQKFEDTISKIKISKLSINDSKIVDLLSRSSEISEKLVYAHEIEWSSDSNLGEEKEIKKEEKIVLITIPSSDNDGIMIRDNGYAEKIMACSNYKILSDEILFVSTNYLDTTSEEKIWFTSDNIRCRASTIKMRQSSGILQTSYTSEIRRLSSKK